MSGNDCNDNQNTSQNELKSLLSGEQLNFPCLCGVRRILVVDDPYVKQQWENNLSLKAQLDVMGVLLALMHDPSKLSDFDIDVLDAITQYGAKYDNEYGNECELVSRSNDLFILHEKSNRVHVAVTVKMSGEVVILYTWPFNESDDAGKACNRKPCAALSIIESRYHALKG
ncbi:MAG: hypothetical protein HLUCCO02_09030 [Idiomarinaceae bacterium HL-53]|nr:MAG: hypothetical protein HLUCCO02_09030 [Idiomarinaceae bacterium HL-53]CUS47675.1 hypothetical protein Ga0003345_0608 [Idiomarinaceae bacterium HL-53]